MFLGQFYHNIDQKGRLTVPARFREELSAQRCIVMQGFDENLMLLTSTYFEELSRRLNGMSLTDPTARLLRRLIFSTAHQVDLDKSGRVLLPPFLRDTLSIGNEVVVVGAGDYVEIWSSMTWDSQSDQLHDAQQNAHRFSALNLSTE